MITSGSASMLNRTILLGSQVMSSYCDVNTSLTPSLKRKLSLTIYFMYLFVCLSLLRNLLLRLESRGGSLVVFTLSSRWLLEIVFSSGWSVVITLVLVSRQNRKALWNRPLFELV